MNGNQSSQQTGQSLQPYKGVNSPKSLGSQNQSTASSRTAWSNDSNPYGTPQPLSKQTAGSFYKWDDNSTAQTGFRKE